MYLETCMCPRTCVPLWRWSYVDVYVHAQGCGFLCAGGWGHPCASGHTCVTRGMCVTRGTRVTRQLCV